MDTLANLVANNFEEIRKNFRSGLKDKGYPWDEDIMSDAFVSCMTTLKDRLMSKQEALKYYWVAYINKYKTASSKSKILSYEEELDDVINIKDESRPYDKTIDKIYDIILSELQDHYGIRKAYIWEMYVCKDIPSKEILAMGFKDVKNFAYFTKQVKRYIQNHIIPQNKELQELINTRKDSSWARW
jgi:hypothetical protein